MIALAHPRAPAAEPRSAELELEELLAESPASALARQREWASEIDAADLGRLVLFGAGALGRHALAKLRAAGVEPVAFADNNPRLRGSKVEGVEVCSPADALVRFGPGACFVVAIYTGACVLRQLRSLGARAVPFARLFIRFPGSLYPFWSLDYPTQILARADRIRLAMGLWSDETSRREFVAQVRYRLHQGEEMPASLPPAEIYFPADLRPLRSSERFVDCGAYDGDSIRGFLSRTGDRFERIVALEPDPANCARLRDFLARLDSATARRIEVKQAAASDRRQQARFSADGAVWSGMNGEGSVLVDCEPLDETLAGLSPTLIKMDIEGAELSALAGAGDILRGCAPALAVCLYHKADHLWEAPLLIHALNPDYELYLRRYSDYCWETVCYAVKPEAT